MLERYGRYEALRKIASGGMATVYLGRVSGEGGFERLVALKVMHPHIASDPEFVAMFLDEARLAAQIRHPNVVATIDIQKTPQATFLVMDYVDGPSLQEVRKFLKTRGQRIPVEIALRIFIDVLNGLQQAHDLTDKRGECLHLVHRDVSPHNILVGRDGVARLTDFGVARAEARISSTRGGQLKGKIAYMPPEQIVADPVTRQSDVYSVGVCLWEAIVGRRLFRAPNDGAMVHVILAGNPPPPSQFAPCPPAVERVLMQALAREPEGRFAEAVDMADALEIAARQSGIRIPRARDVGRFIKRIADEIEAAPPVSHVFSEPSTADSEGVSQPSLSPESDSLRSTPEPESRPPMSGPLISGEIELSSVDPSHPSSVTSPTHTSASYSLKPRPSRNGLIAVGVAGLLATGAIVALMTTRPEREAAPASMAPPTASEHEPPASESIPAKNEEGVTEVETAEKADEPSKENAESSKEAAKDAPKEAAKDAPNKGSKPPQQVIHPPSPAPKPAPTQFRPTEL